MMQRFVQGLQRLLYPSDAACMRCGRMHQQHGWCEDCARELALCKLPADLCGHCGQPLNVKGECELCTKTAMPEARSVWVHQGAARDLIHMLKYDSQTAAAALLAQGMAEAAKPWLPNNESIVVTWAPMPRSRYTQRYRDHAQVLAQQVAQRLSLPLQPTLTRPEGLRRIRHQVGLTGEQRADNLRGTFASLPDVHGTILLVDDVLTTGATAACCAQCLLQGGAQRVLVLTATRAVPKHLLLAQGEIDHV